MKKLLLFVVLLLLTSWISFAANSLQAQCDTLIAKTKGTQLETFANAVCNTALGIKAKAPVKNQPTIKKKRIGVRTNERADTSISMDQLKSIVSSSIIKGNAKARFLIIEYSDLQCPFCKRQWDDKTIETVIKDYDGKVASAFRSFPLSFHNYSTSGAYALECVALQDKSRYYDFIDWVLWRWLNSETDLHKVAQELDLDLKRLKDCMATSTVQILVSKQIEQGINLFGISWTPGNVILDTITGKYKVIVGAQPASEFKKVLDKIAK